MALQLSAVAIHFGGPLSRDRHRQAHRNLGQEPEARPLWAKPLAPNHRNGWKNSTRIAAQALFGRQLKLFQYFAFRASRCKTPLNTRWYRPCSPTRELIAT